VSTERSTGKDTHSQSSLFSLLHPVTSD